MIFLFQGFIGLETRRDGRRKNKKEAQTRLEGSASLHDSWEDKMQQTTLPLKSRSSNNIRGVRCIRSSYDSLKSNPLKYITTEVVFCVDIDACFFQQH